MKRIFQANDIIEASIVKGLLESRGISAHVSGFYLQGAIGEIPPTGNTAIWAGDDDCAKAQRIIEEYQD